MLRKIHNNERHKSMQHKINFLLTRRQQRKSKTWLSSMLTVLLISISLLLSSCASASSLASVNSSGTSTPVATTSHTPTPAVTPSPPPATKLPPLTALRMIDASTGWALTQPNLYSEGGYILRTSDGGQHWKNVSPPYSSGQQYDDGEATAFLTSTIAWVVTARHRVYHTADGGQSWQERQLSPPIQGSKATYITFINPENGWLVFTASATNGEEITIFRTTDGGNTWTAISSTGTSTTQLPNGAYDWTVGFLDATTGWASSGYSNLTSPAWFYMTHDGGVSWHHQSLPLPTSETAARLWILAPTFLTATDGLLPVLFYATSNDEGIDIYVTHNGGTSWNSTAPQYTSVPQSNGAAQTLAEISLPDMNTAWVIGNNGTSLSTTQDGGQHWQTVSVPAQRGVQAISFLSHLAGWMLVRPDFDTSSLYKTTDGGRSWVEIFQTSL